MKLADLPEDAVIHEAGPRHWCGVWCIYCDRFLTGNLLRTSEGQFIVTYVRAGQEYQDVVDDATEATCCDGKK